MKFYKAGYYILKQNNMNKLSLTTSDCINEIYPNSWALNWVNIGGEELKEYQNKLKLDKSKFQELRNYITKEWENQNFDFPNVFQNLDTLNKFRYKYLNNIKYPKIIGIYFDAEMRKFYLENESYDRDMDGVLKMLERNLQEDKNGIEIGFDIIGFESGGSYHSFLCNDLEDDYKNIFNVKLNENNLIRTYDDAKKVIDYTNDDILSGAKPVNWYIIKLKQFE